MTNAQIIQNECIIRGINEDIHTFSAWKSAGFVVRKGEKAIAKFPIWKYTAKEDEETGEEKSRMFMKTAAFFARSQVEKMA